MIPKPITGYMIKLKSGSVLNIGSLLNRRHLVIILSLFITTLQFCQAERGLCENWSVDTIRLLPDSGFALVVTGKNGANKVRYCPHHDLNGHLDASQLIYVLGTFNQINWPDAQTKAKAQKHLNKHYTILKNELNHQALHDPLNINTAGLTDLVMLPHIGPVLAVRIVEYRQTNPFRQIEDIKKVAGVGAGTFNAIRHYITLHGK